MKINKSTAYNWIKALNKRIENPKPKSEDKISKEKIEMDELYSYTTHKKKNLFIAKQLKKCAVDSRIEKSVRLLLSQERQKDEN